MTESSLLGCLNVVIDSIWEKKRSVFEFAEVANKNDHSLFINYVLMSSYLFKSYNIKCEFKKECPLHFYKN